MKISDPIFPIEMDLAKLSGESMLKAKRGMFFTVEMGKSSIIRFWKSMMGPEHSLTNL